MNTKFCIVDLFPNPNKEKKLVEFVAFSIFVRRSPIDADNRVFTRTVISKSISFVGEFSEDTLPSMPMKIEKRIKQFLSILQ